MMQVASRRAVAAAALRARGGAARGFASVGGSDEDFTPADPKSIDYAGLGFGYTPTKSMAVYNFDWNNGWDNGQLQASPFLRVHALSNVIHYGQSIFEGLKAFHTKDGRVCAFNPKGNAERMRNGARRLGMPEVPEAVFLEAIERVVKDNVDYVPPYGSEGSFYLRPFLTGHGAKLGLGVAPKFMLGCMGSPVGNYYKNGIKPINAAVIDYDRAAPRGVGDVKCAGNYAADVKPAKEAQDAGFEIALYLDPKERKYIEEFSTSNLIAISKDKSTLITPKSDSILPSITNVMLQQIAKDKGLKVERRPLSLDELKEMGEVGACGTAVVISIIGSVTHKGERQQFNTDCDVLMDLYEELRGIQTGVRPDNHGWLHHICDKPLP